MSNNLNFRISSGLKNILGHDLITNDNIAVLELVKNSYDAYASKVEITFENGELIIADNGKGMSYADLINKWFFVGYSAKRDGTEDASSYRSKIKRHYAGAKGIGRLSCDRLAHNLTLITKSADSSTTEQIEIDWSKFENDSKDEFGNISIPYFSLTNNPAFPKGGETGTILKFTNLRTEWSKKNILSLRNSLEKMINPFAEVSDFQIEIKALDLAENDQIEVNGSIDNRMASILSLKTTQIESRLTEKTVTTTLSDRGTLMYKIEEDNNYSYLKDISINLYYLNRKAKYNFSQKMGIDAINYGNVFLFRNGFRIYPYGEPDDDSWGLNKRVQQGYNRYLGTRDLIGRVDVLTSNVENFKEVSSRDGGLIQTDASLELFDYFSKIHHLLERYVGGVLWGLNFSKNNYFNNAELGESEKKKIQEEEKDSENIEHVFNNIGSRVDFVQLIKNLTNNSSIRVVEYNKDLVNIVNDVSELNKLQVQFIEDLRKVANQVNDNDLVLRINAFEKELKTLHLKNKDAERRAYEETQKRLDAEQRATEEKNKREEAEAKQKKAEKELERKIKQNLFLQSVNSLDTDKILNFHHDIRIQALTIENVLSDIVDMINKNNIDADRLSKKTELISRANARIISISQFATKANFNSTSNSITADIVLYIFQYVTKVLPDYYNDIKLDCSINDCDYQITFKPLEVSLMIDNMLSNSIKAHAKNFKIEFSIFLDPKRTLCIAILDDGVGLSDEITESQSVFEKGVTTTNGSGLGLYNVAMIVEKQLFGKIEVDDFYKATDERKGFKLLITI